MLRPLIAGNWKMNTTLDQGVSLVMKLREVVKKAQDVEVVIAPPFTSLHHLNFLVAGSPIKLAAQDVFWEKNGAFTGEVSAEMLKNVGCEYVIIGHSERRRLFGETDETVNKKIVSSLREGLKPIVCIGETLEEREEGKIMATVKTQLKNAFKGLGPGTIKEIAVAYEPVWAIGTGRNATPEQAEEVHNALRHELHETYGTQATRDIRIIYGGSVKASTMNSLMAQPNIDGVLVGGASLDADEFSRIVNFKKSPR